MGRKKKDTDKNDGAPCCPAGHALECRTAKDAEYECDVCHGDILNGNVFFGCTPCDYSMCNACYIKVATGEIEIKVAAPTAPDIPADVITGARIDPDVAELCEHFAVEDRIMLKLNEVMRDRHESFSGDMEKLWEELSYARSPAGLLMAKIRQIQEGRFKGKEKTPKEVQRLIDKYRLDSDARSKLTGFIVSRPDTQEKDIFEIERRLENSGNPSATAMMMMVKLHKGEPLPEPLRGTPHRDFADITKSGKGGGKGKDGDDRGGKGDGRGSKGGHRDSDRGGGDRDRERGREDRGDRRGGDRRDYGDRRRSRSRGDRGGGDRDRRDGDRDRGGDRGGDRSWGGDRGGDRGGHQRDDRDSNAQRW